ncbi:MAG: glycosyltransferase family 9 protein [Candidatus Delongbacteria bacterium]|nr:glycosyltransferase family 9 protein [Candidatus Delongbacteria bacterium]
MLWGSLLPRRPQPAAIERILVINISVLGDSLLLLPLLQAIHRTYPGLQIEMLVANENQKVYGYETFYHRLEIFSLKRIPVYFFRALVHPYSAVIDTGQWVRLTACLTALHIRSWKIGFSTPGQYRHYAFDRLIPHNPGQWEFYHYAHLFSFLELENLHILPAIHYPETAIEHSILQRIPEKASSAKRIVIHPGAGNLNKSWRHYRELVDRLLDQTPHILIITGKSGEEFDKNGLRDHPRLINLQERTNLYTLNEIIRGCDLFICGNTGPLYLAAFLHKKVITIPGPVSTNQWFWPNPEEQCLQSGRPCHPCVYLGFEYRCRTADCLDDITVEDMIECITRCLI